MTKKMLFVVAGCLLACVGAQAGIIIGQPPTGSNCIPFGCGVNGTQRYQQVYNASQFTGPIVISNIRFYATLLFGDQAIWPGIYSFHFSTTPKAVNGLVQDFNQNVGPDDAFFALMSGGGSIYPSFTVNGTPFNYNPALGNLLLDITITYIGQFSNVLASPDFNGGAGITFSRMYDNGTFVTGRGLVTGFNEGPTDVPEPSTLAMLTGGLLLLLAARRRNA